jgi:hypothetical protein
MVCMYNMDGDTIGLIVGITVAGICMSCLACCLFRYWKRPGGMMDENTV